MMPDHMYFNYNYGLYFTFWDRIGGTHRVPAANLGNGPLDQVRKQHEVKDRAPERENKPKAA